jgi:hypothetical protein
MVDDLIKSLKAQLYERASSPLLSVFVLSWLLWNYRFVSILFSTIPVIEKFNFIDTKLFSTYEDYLLRGFSYPLITTLLFIFVYPYPAKFVYQFWRNRLKELKEIRQKIEDETPLTIEESRNIKREALRIQLTFEKELDARAEEVKRLKEYIESLQGTKSTLKETYSGIGGTVGNEKISDEQLKILQLVAENGDRMTQASIIRKSGANANRVKFDLIKLMENNYLQLQLKKRQGDRLYLLTRKGRAYLIDAGQYQVK